jgi:hypothetical protein
VTWLNEDVQPVRPLNTVPGPLSSVEPSADVRGMAGFCRQLYVALLDQQFASDQALDLVGRAVQGVCTGIELT